MALSERDLRFLDLYFGENFNATEAMIKLKPHLSRGSAATEGWRMLNRVEIKEEIHRREIELRAKHRLTVEQFGDMLQEAATVDIADCYNDDGSMKRLTEMPPAVRRQIASIEPITIEIIKQVGKGKTAHIEREVRLAHKIKLWDLRKAQELWGKWKKMYTDKIEGPDGGPLQVSITIKGPETGT